MNPLFLKEKLQKTRKKTLAQTILATNLLMLAMILLPVLTEEKIAASFSLNGFASCAYILFLVLTIQVPIQAGSGIAGEKERNQLEFLLASGLGVTDLILGKLTACMVEMLVLFAGVLPVFGMLMIFGGLHLLYLLYLLVFLVSYLIFLCALGTYCSCLVRTSIQGVIMTYLTLLVLIGASYLLCFGIAGSHLMNLGQELTLTTLLQAGNPVTALMILCAECTGNRLQVLKILQGIMVIRSGFFFRFQWLFSAAVLWTAAIILIRRSIQYVEEHEIL